MVVNKEYRAAMQQRISLSDEDKARILANVQKAYEEDPEQNNVILFEKNHRISVRQMGVVVAACLVLAANIFLIRDQFQQGRPGVKSDMPVSPGAVSGASVVSWQEYKTIDDIEKNTDCRTYQLSNLSKDYQVEKVEVANEERHVRITYKNKKKKDTILFEYKEEESSRDIIDQFADENEIKTKKVDGSMVTMYGDKKCNGMTWEEEECTFGIRMSKVRSIKSAENLVSAKLENTVHSNQTDKDKSKEDTDSVITPKAPGWEEEDEDESMSRENERVVLASIMEQQGFNVVITEPATDIVYKNIDDFESFAFRYDAPSVIEGHRIIGYAGWDGSPENVIDEYESEDVLTVSEVEVTLYRKGKKNWLLTFTKKDIDITLLISEFSFDQYSDEEKEDIIKQLFSVIKVEKEKEETEPKTTEPPKDSAATKSSIDAEPEDEEEFDDDYLNSTTVTP